MALVLFVVDSSEGAARNDDFPCGSRLSFQHHVVRVAARSFAASLGPASIGVVSGGRVVLPPAEQNAASFSLLPEPAASAAPRTAALVASLKVALLVAKRAPAGGLPRRVVAFVASQVPLAGLRTAVCSLHAVQHP
jgi:hypothetical protein